MFTGLIQALGTVRTVSPDYSGGRVLTIAGLESIAPGESIAVNGACLTATGSSDDSCIFQAGPETLLKTALGTLVPGDRVNLERALKAGDPIGGHFVTGHVDCVGTILDKAAAGDWLTIQFGFPKEFGELLVGKGSIAVDGVSLTVVDAEPERFSVMLIPHTRDHTTLGIKEAGAAVNLEFDLLAKHVRKLMQSMTISI